MYLEGATKSVLIISEVLWVSFRKMGKGRQNNTYEKYGEGAKGVRAIARLLVGSGAILFHKKKLNLYPQRCIIRLICGSQMT